MVQLATGGKKIKLEKDLRVRNKKKKLTSGIRTGTAVANVRRGRTSIR